MKSAPNQSTGILLLIISFLYWVSLYLYVPTLPLVVSDRVGGLFSQIGMILAMYGLWQMLSRFPVGILADRFGIRKQLAIFLLFSLAVGTLLLGYAREYWSLLIARSITGFAAATWVLLVVLYVSLFDAQSTLKATATISLVFALGRISATLLSGPIIHLAGEMAPFFLSAIAAVLGALVLIFTRLPAQITNPIDTTIIWMVISRREVLIPTLLSIILHYGDWAATFSFIPLRAKELGANAQQVSFILVLELIIILLSNWCVNKLTRKTGRFSILVSGFILHIAAMILVYLTNSLPALWVAQGLIGAGYGLAYPVLMSMAIEKVDAHSQSIATGFHQSVYALGMFLGPSISGAISMLIGIRFSFIVNAVMILFFAGAGVTILYQKSRDQQSFDG